MSRIGKKIINLPEKVQLHFEGKLFKAMGPKGQLEIELPENISCTCENNQVIFTRANDEKHTRALHGLTRSLAANIIEGVSSGFTKTLQIEGVGYKVEMRGTRLLLSMGYSHQVLVIPPDGITFESPSVTSIKIHGIDKQLIGQVTADIRKVRPPEPYKGKGIRYAGEYIHRKTGKTTAK